MAEKASKWPKNTNSTRIFVTEAGSFEKNWLNDENGAKCQKCHSTRIFGTEAGSWKKFLLNGANSRFRNERGFEEKYVNE